MPNGVRITRDPTSCIGRKIARRSIATRRCALSLRLASSIRHIAMASRALPALNAIIRGPAACHPSAPSSSCIHAWHESRHLSRMKASLRAHSPLSAHDGQLGSPSLQPTIAANGIGGENQHMHHTARKDSSCLMAEWPPAPGAVTIRVSPLQQRRHTKPRLPLSESNSHEKAATIASTCIGKNDQDANGSEPHIQSHIPADSSCFGVHRRHIATRRT